MKKRRKFLHGGAIFTAYLGRKGTPYQESYEQEYCAECAGAGMGCFCGDGLVEWLVIEYEACGSCGEPLTIVGGGISCDSCGWYDATGARAKEKQEL